MNFKNVLIASVAGAVVMMLLGYIVYVMLLGDVMTSSVSKDPDMGLVFAGHLFGSGLLAYIYNRWANISTFSTGAVAGLVIGILVELYFVLIMMGTTTMFTTNAAVTDIIATGVIFAIAGGVIGIVLGKLSS